MEGQAWPGLARDRASPSRPVYGLVSDSSLDSSQETCRHPTKGNPCFGRGCTLVEVRHVSGTRLLSVPDQR